MAVWAHCQCWYRRSVCVGAGKYRRRPRLSHSCGKKRPLVCTTVLRPAPPTAFPCKPCVPAGCYFSPALLEPAFKDPALSPFLCEARLRQYLVRCYVGVLGVGALCTG